MLYKSYKSSHKNDSTRMRKMIVTSSYKPSIDGGDDGTRTRASSYITEQLSIKSVSYKSGYNSIFPRIYLNILNRATNTAQNFQSQFIGGMR